MGGDDGSNMRSVKTDANGILKIRDEYPNNYQAIAPTLGTGSAAGVSVDIYRQLGNSFTIHPYGKSAIYINRVGATGSFMLYVMGSEDNINFYPVGSTSTWDGSAQDTLKTTVETQTLIIPLPQDVYFGRYCALWATETVDMVADSTMTIAHWGRLD
jgi:hypothetical protein